MLNIIQRKAIPRGDAQFEANRQDILNKVAARIPKELHIPKSLIENPPLNVTGVPADCGLLTPAELDITSNYGLVDLAEAIRVGRLTSVEVTTAFCKRAMIAHQLTFCLSDIYMEEALSRAKELDEHLARTGKVVGPLHGVPISVKETVPVAGQLWSAGLAASRMISPKDCLLIETARELGAVFYVKTHQPALVFSLESTSFLGRTLNPHNIDLSSGGSSGGEGALLALRGSPFGIGSDLGGSIRIPASFCGVYGFKASSGFLPMRGMQFGPSPPDLSLDSIIGPMGHSLRDLDYFLNHVLSRKLYLKDPDTLPIPYTGLGTAKRASTLKVGILKTYGIVQPQPPVAQALEWAGSQLQQHGFDVLPYTFYKPEQAHKLFNNLVVHDGMKGALGALQAGNEPTFPVFEGLISHAFSLDPDAARGREETAIPIAARRFERDIFRAQFLEDWISQGDPDVVICPMSPASVHDTGNLIHNTSNPHFWNVLDYPGLIVPSPFKVEDKVEYDKDVAVLSEADRVVRELWSGYNYAGAPISFNVVAKRHMENELLAAVGMMQEALQLP
ncbi:related to general amidase [Ramularia collo-cygni]|uniref:amidase n=1 Tax=Ramularia collo-cygni TaxID=112498 RepID=A0A2D3V2H4_9PEZI|nr:related to general amidase [Ramularia collo-cygni]CZT24477.1 related to general amidase [Ramularia collo-cygni]